VNALSRPANHGAQSDRDVWEALARLPDPEIPVLSIIDLGIVRFVRRSPEGELHVGITPTYSGCPATDLIRRTVRDALDALGREDAVIEEVFAPAWTSDWITAEGRRKLREFGIAAPPAGSTGPRGVVSEVHECPRCGSARTQRVSEFGSTPCKAHYRCLACLEPFDQFKCL